MADLTTDNTAARMFYVPMSGVAGDSNHEFVPSPNINLSIETFYANESIIGYTYNVTLTGYAASKQSRDDAHDDTISYVVGSIAKIQNIFDNVGNGGKLIITAPGGGSGNNELMVFKGGRIKRIDFAPSNNQWVRYSEYTIEIEFNDAKLFGCNHNTDKGCSSSLFDGQNSSGGLGVVQSQLVDHGASSPTGFKIKSFSDNFSMDLQDEIYEWAKIDNIPELELNNKRYNVSYTINAIGQHYWDDDGKLFPAWKQAKAFCQDRLVKQINGLYQNMAMHYQGDELSFCGSNEDLTEIHIVDTPSIHTTIGAYNIFDEKITFGPSESDGGFEISYSSILKRNVNNSVTHSDATHTLNIVYGGSKEYGRSQAKSATLSGTIQGLLRYTSQGSIIWPNAEGFQIPENPGTMVFLPPKTDVKYKWAKAKELLDRFLDESTGKITDIKLAEVVTKYFEIDCFNRFPGQECSEDDPTAFTDLFPNSFSVTHNYALGSIDYSVEFTPESKSRCNITISTEEPVPITAEFTIPGRGIYYQPLGGCTPKKWTINVEGTTGCPVSCNTLSSGTNLFNNVCSDLPIGCEEFMPNDSVGTYLLQSKQKTHNPIDGSFSYNATYVCTNCSGQGSC